MKLLLILVAISVVACQTPTPIEPQATVKSESRLDTQLVLNNAILEQSNKQENIVWKIKADNLIYSEDRQTAVLKGVVGNLLQDDKIILKISAKMGEVRDNGNIMVLQENVIASDTRNDSIIKSELVEWRPQENLLLIKEKFNGIRANLNVDANRGKYFTDTENLEIEGNVVATTDEPPLQLKSDRLIWNIPQNKIKSPGAVEMVRHDQEKVTERLNSDSGEIDLNRHIATLNSNIEFISLEPKLQAATESLSWNYQQRIGKTERPIQIIDRDRALDLTGNRGEIDLQQQVAKLEGGVKGINRQKSSQLYARQLTWKIDTQRVEAIGNIIYEQADPQARLTGEKAVGTLGDNNIVVTSDGKKQVTSTINK